MSTALLGIYVTGRRQFTKVKVDRLLVFFSQNLSSNMHVQSKIYWEFYHDIVCIAIEEHDIKISDIQKKVLCFTHEYCRTNYEPLSYVISCIYTGPWHI